MWMSLTTQNLPLPSALWDWLPTRGVYAEHNKQTNSAHTLYPLIIDTLQRPDGIFTWILCCIRWASRWWRPGSPHYTLPFTTDWGRRSDTFPSSATDMVTGRRPGWCSWRVKRERQRNSTSNFISDQMEVRPVSLPASLSWSARTAWVNKMETQSEAKRAPNVVSWLLD